MKKLMLTLGFLALAVPALAQSHEVNEITVKGMVCDFCAQSLTKVFGKIEGVEKTEVNLDTQTVTVTMKPGASLSDEDIKQSIYYAGYDYVSHTSKTEGQ